MNLFRFRLELVHFFGFLQVLDLCWYYLPRRNQNYLIIYPRQETFAFGDTYIKQVEVFLFNLMRKGALFTKIHTKLQFNPLTTNVSHHIGTNQLICNTNQLTGFYMMGNIGR